MSHIFPTAGMKAHIGPAKASNGSDFSASDFTTGSPTWTEIGGTTNLGSTGDVSALITSDQINVKRTRKAKGTRNAGSMQIICDLDYADPGQLALIAAEKVKDSFAFRMTLDDAPSGGTPSVRYFVGFVMSVTEQYEEANGTLKLAATIEIDSNIVKVPAET